VSDDDVEYKGSVDFDEVSDLARRVVEGWDIRCCIESAKESLVDFWSSRDGAEDYARCI